MLTGKKLTLGPLQPDDVATLFRWINDRAEVLHNAPYRPISWAEHLNWFEGVQKSQGTTLFAIRVKGTQTLIGTCQLTGIHAVHRNAELRIRLGDETSRGQGHGTEAVALLLAFAFEDLNLERVWLHVFADNERAARVYQKCGFQDEGILRHAAFIDGRFVSIRAMAVLRSEYARRDPPA